MMFKHIFDSTLLLIVTTLFLSILTTPSFAGENITIKDGCYYAGTKYHAGEYLELDKGRRYCGKMIGGTIPLSNNLPPAEKDSNNISEYSYSHFAWSAPANNSSSRNNPKDVFYGGCFYEGKLYSESSSITVDDEEYVCWHAIRPPNTNEEISRIYVLSNTWEWKVLQGP